MRHNGVLPNAHFRKHWQGFVRTWFNQAARKRRRQLSRQAKSAGTNIFNKILIPDPLKI